MGHQEIPKLKVPITPSGRFWPGGQKAAGSRWAAQPRQARSPAPPGAPQSGQRSPKAQERSWDLGDPHSQARVPPMYSSGGLSTHLNVLLARHENKDVPRGPRQVDLQGLLHRSLHVIFLWGLQHRQRAVRRAQWQQRPAASRGHTALSPVWAAALDLGTPTSG